MLISVATLVTLSPDLATFQTLCDLNKLSKSNSQQIGRLSQVFGWVLTVTPMHAGDKVAWTHVPASRCSHIAANAQAGPTNLRLFDEIWYYDTLCGTRKLFYCDISTVKPKAAVCSVLLLVSDSFSISSCFDPTVTSNKTRRERLTCRSKHIWLTFWFPSSVINSLPVIQY